MTKSHPLRSPIFTRDGWLRAQIMTGVRSFQQPLSGEAHRYRHYLRYIPPRRLQEGTLSLLHPYYITNIIHNGGRNVLRVYASFRICKR